MFLMSVAEIVARSNGGIRMYDWSVLLDHLPSVLMRPSFRLHAAAAVAAPILNEWPLK